MPDLPQREQNSDMQRHSLPSAENVTLRRLDNGILLAARENFTSPAVVLGGLLQVGSMDEPDDKTGLANMTAALLSRGTQAMDYDALNEVIEGVGASVSIYGRTHTTAASTKSLVEDFPIILTQMVEMLRYPTFPADHLERIRAQRITSLHERMTNTRSVAEMLFYESAYPLGHPYHRDASGTPESIAALTRDELIEFHRAHYGPDGAIFVVVGAVAAEEALDLLEAALGSWAPLPEPPISRVVAPVAWPEQPISKFHAMPGKTQSDLVYGLPTIPRNDPDYMALQMANLVLGVFGMMGRIGKVVRDEQGLAYYARSGIDATLGPSAWTASAGVSPDKVEQALQAIKTEWVRMGSELVPEEELNDSKALMSGSLPLRLETNEGVARTLLDILYYDLGLDYLLTYRERVAAISPEEVRRVSQHYFDPAHAILAVAGP
ncbi:MAG: insulinase family protein [Ardenticatenales bacterium]|nr:insulinase family protein [Ardenticatenales bacterium]